LAGEVDRAGRERQQLVVIVQAAEDGGLVVHDQEGGAPGVNGRVLG
jgi:ribosomal protein L14E/L6E/L27E